MLFAEIDIENNEKKLDMRG